AAFITPHALVTVRHDEDFDIDQVVERWDNSMELAKSGVGFLLHGLLDYIVDGHFEVIQTLDDEIESLEDLMFAERPDQTDLQRRALALRKSLVLVRRVVLPMREVVNSLMRRDLHLVDDQMAPYFQDVYDHVLRVTEWTESLRDLVTTLRETQLNLQSNRLNSIMKKVTGWAAIIAVPTAITGYYGQNVPFPGSQQAWGFWTSTSVVVALSVGLYVLFRRKDWL
ncbi:MAG TPA: magnesium transporter CorA family protein, partial [Nocardioidaceae bacterium]|nr:magnesium transporter CorA family protein [Nocardioidaceae bacterium]